MGYSDFANIFSDKTTYKPVEKFAQEHSINLAELKATTTAVLKESGKLPAIKHINAFFGLSRPLPLFSTKNYVEQIEAELSMGND
ncbi:hypothetical protein [Psychromonas sp. 14N.309.X.WAT.B.A12]|uniref:hypothetical protein n=1 Tax=unclassified Psychromonas TaxID=2614957 RepID=UPI0025B02112|nr:hypothetical protein [Psychromonas sp. 14N.309.X.WAT.B.A12]MDN2663757.1 hypothetical protein [Psychromonas sp. 14N.309.X.WAT.B.A12]